MSSTRIFAQQLPDLPRWVEARALLLADACEVYGFQAAPTPALVLRDPDGGTVFIVGQPTRAAVQAALQKNTTGGEVIAPFAQTAWLASLLPGWTPARILVHQLADPPRLPDPPVGSVRFLNPAFLSQLVIPVELKAELYSGAASSPIAATFVDEQPVAFCYAGAITETLWDVAIDTLLEHRRQGYAGLCAAYLIRHLQAKGLRPVWQALASNPASWRLAQKLGFVPVDDLVMFTPPGAG